MPEEPGPHETAEQLRASYELWRTARGFTTGDEPSVFAYPAFAPGFDAMRVLMVGMSAREAATFARDVAALAQYITIRARPPRAGP